MIDLCNVIDVLTGDKPEILCVSPTRAGHRRIPLRRRFDACLLEILEDEHVVHVPVPVKIRPTGMVQRAGAAPVERGRSQLREGLPFGAMRLECSPHPIGEPDWSLALEIEGRQVGPGFGDDLVVLAKHVTDLNERSPELGYDDLDVDRLRVVVDRLLVLHLLPGDDDAMFKQAGVLEDVDARLLEVVGDPSVVHVPLRVHVRPAQLHLHMRHQSSLGNNPSTMSSYACVTTLRRIFMLAVVPPFSTVSSWSRIANFFTVSQRSSRELTFSICFSTEA